MNKSIYLVLSLWLLVAVLPSRAQLFKGEIIGGFNVSQVDGDEVYGFNRLGINAGAGVEIAFSDKWSVSLENLYSEKGSYQKKQFEDSITGEYDLRLNYLEVPVMLHYNDKDRIKVGLGFSWGRLVKASETEQGGNVTPYIDSVPFNENDINILADFRFRLYKRLKLDFRYSYSVSKIREREFFNYNNDTWIRKQYNNLFSIRLIYVFNEKLENIKKPDEE